MLQLNDDTRPNLEYLLRQWITKDAFTDQHIADALHVTSATVGMWRRALGIPKSKKFERHFREKHGADAMERFKALLWTCESYAEIGRLFNLSRERTRQIANTHFREVLDARPKPWE